MNSEFWLTSWQQNRIGFHQSQTNGYLMDYWSELALSPGSQVFVPLCGKSLDLLWLKQQGYDVLGVELSHLAIMQFLAENGIAAQQDTIPSFSRYTTEQLCLLQGDFFELHAQYLKGVDAVFDRASLVALPHEKRIAYAAHLQNCLPAHAKMLLIAFDYAQSCMQGPPFAVSYEEIKTLYQARFTITQLLSDDVLASHPRFRDSGLPALQENVYLLTPHGVC